MKNIDCLWTEHELPNWCTKNDILQVVYSLYGKISMTDVGFKTVCFCDY